MTTAIEDELGPSRRDNYCSSSEDEEEELGGCEANSGQCSNGVRQPKISSGMSYNTGPKGVLEDWRQFKELEAEKRAQREQELVTLIKQTSLACSSHREDEERKKLEEQLANEKCDSDSDEFMGEYVKKRMREMMQLFNASKNPRFGIVYNLTDPDQFLQAIDVESKEVTVCIHLYESKVKACNALDQCLTSLAKKYSMIKFCRIQASLVGASKRLQTIGLPALLVYRNCQLIGNFVSLSEEVSDDFEPDDVEQFLKEYGILAES